MDNSLFQHYQAQKAALVQLIEALQGQGFKQDWQERLSSIRQNLESGQFRLVVLGQFKRGKSTFLNALLGEPVLPTDVIPVTAVITELVYSREKYAEVIFLDGRRSRIDLDELAQYVSETANPENQKQVDLVVVHHPAKLLQQGLILVDTPGVGSIHEHNTRLTRQYLPAADASIFLLSADPPLTELEKAFIGQIQPLVPRMFFVLNKKDYLSPAALDRVLAFNRQVLEALLQQPVEVYPVSALQALEAGLQNDETLLAASGFRELEAVLEQFLLAHKGSLLIQANAHRLERLVLERKNYIQMEIQAQKLSVEKLERGLEEFHRFVADIRRQKQRLAYLLEGIKQRLMELFDQELQSFLEHHAGDTLKAFQDFLRTQKDLSNKKLLDRGEQMINEAVIDHFEPFRLRIEKMVQSTYEEEIRAINEETRRLINRLYHQAADLFQLKALAELPGELWEFESEFYYRTWEAMTTLTLLENDLTTLLPRRWFLRYYQRKAAGLIARKLERQGGRLRADLLYRIQENNRQFLYQFDQTVSRIEQDIVQLIETQVARKQKGEIGLQRFLESQQNQQALLDEVLAGLKPLVSTAQAARNPALPS
ncbi:MAG: hypothetical protein D6715_13275 [Calditrichaeota bacterium]|nr:MAG: hypothetical protein D6715_13275 [Calditrichota bacterium]